MKANTRNAHRRHLIKSMDHCHMRNTGENTTAPTV